MTRVLRERVMVGLADHTLLVAKDATERPIADFGAPIRDEKNEILGVVPVSGTGAKSGGPSAWPRHGWGS